MSVVADLKYSSLKASIPVLLQLPSMPRVGGVDGPNNSDAGLSRGRIVGLRGGVIAPFKESKEEEGERVEGEEMGASTNSTALVDGRLNDMVRISGGFMVRGELLRGR